MSNDSRGDLRKPQTTGDQPTSAVGAFVGTSTTEESIRKQGAGKRF